MDFMKLLKSLEELLYELVSWVIFYPLTLWRILIRPLTMLAYAERELQVEEVKQYDDAVSPPILLLISLGVLHAIQNVMTPADVPTVPGMLADERNLLAFRAVAFSLFPLVFGLIQLKCRGARVTRATFKPVFYSQCYAVVPFVIAVSLGLNLITLHHHWVLGILSGLMLLIVGFVWYAAVGSLWLAAGARMHVIKAALITLATLLCVLPLFFAIAALAGYTMSADAPR